MGLTSRQRKSAERKALRAKKKSDYKAQADAHKAAHNTGKKRKVISSFRHQVANCGNPGCSRCFPQYVKA